MGWTRSAFLWLILACLPAVAQAQETGQSEDFPEIQAENEGSWLDRTLSRYFGNKDPSGQSLEGRAVEIQRVAEATAEGIRKIASAINEKGGADAVNLRIAQQYLDEFGKLAKTNNTMIIPSDLADIAGVIKTASSVLKTTTPAQT